MSFPFFLPIKNPVKTARPQSRYLIRVRTLSENTKTAAAPYRFFRIEKIFVQVSPEAVKRQCLQKHVKSTIVLLHNIQLVITPAIETDIKTPLLLFQIHFIISSGLVYNNGASVTQMQTNCVHDIHTMYYNICKYKVIGEVYEE